MCILYVDPSRFYKKLSGANFKVSRTLRGAGIFFKYPAKMLSFVIVVEVGEVVMYSHFRLRMQFQWYSKIPFPVKTR